jgi:hypothetical protein
VLVECRFDDEKAATLWPLQRAVNARWAFGESSRSLKAGAKR